METEEKEALTDIGRVFDEIPETETKNQRGKWNTERRVVDEFFYQGKKKKTRNEFA